MSDLVGLEEPMQEDQTEVYYRRTDVSDAPSIALLVDSDTSDLFGDLNLLTVIEKAVLSVSAVSASGVLVGHAAFYDFPLAGSALGGQPKAKSCEKWLDERYETPGITTFNSLYLGYFVVDPTVATHVTAALIRTLFVAVPDIQHCLLAPIEQLEEDNPLADHFNPLKNKVENLSSLVYSTSNEKLFPNVHVRTAEPEDFDDLVPIFNAQSVVLKERYGSDEFYLAELIEAQDDFNKCLVMEVDGVAIGFLSITTELDSMVLKECFELGPWNGLQSMRIETKTVTVQPDPAPEPESKPEGGEEGGDGGDDGAAKDGKGEEKKKNPKKLSKKAQAEADAAAAVAEAKRQAALKPKTKQVDEEVWYESGFAIAMMCIDEEFEARALDLMPEAFKQFPGKDFCVATIPHTCGEPPLLSQFSRAVPKQKSGPPQELYVMHRNALFTDVTIRPATADDSVEIETLIGGMDNHELITADLDRYYATGTDHEFVAISAFVAVSCGDIVGVVVGRNAKDDSSRLRAHYNIEEFIMYPQHATYEHGHLHHFVLNPVFDRHRKYVLREVMRQWGKSNVYYRTYAAGADRGTVAAYTPTYILDDMAPVRRRRQLVYPLDVLGTNAPSHRIRDNGTPYALSFLTRKLMHEPKFTVNNRIVVVGASDTGLSMLETICAKSHLRFNNLTLVSPHGLPKVSTDRPADSFLSRTHAYSANDLQQIALETWVNVVDDRMVAIDREEKVLRLASGAVLPYDTLVLTLGLQYLAENPATTRASVGGETVPNHVYAINDAEDADGFLADLAAQPHLQTDSIVVYGDTVDAYSAIASLLEAGVDGERIEHFRPPSDLAHGACFGHATVAAEVEKAMVAAGVKLHDGLELTGFGRKEGSATDLGLAIFEEPIGPALQVHCDAFLDFSSKRVNPTNFSAVNDACLVFDGKLVVDNTFATADSSIFAAGSFTKYSRKYYDEKASPHHFNSVEVGRALAESIMPLFDTLAGPVELGEREVLTFERPVTVGAKLPGGLLFLGQHAPGPDGGSAAVRDLVTFPEIKAPKTGERVVEFCSVGIDRYQKVTSVVALTSADPLNDRSNLMHVFGTHERYLNNLVSRFDEKLISNFLEFFRHPSVLACFHDRFSDFVEEISEGTRGNPSVKLAEYETMVRKLAETQRGGGGVYATNPEGAKAIQALVETPQTKKFIKDRLIDFLTFNAYHLPMYARPGTY